MMPAMDGYATVARLRDDPETARIPVTIITGQASPTYRPWSEGVGARAHLTKPCSPVRLADTVRRVLTGQPDEPTHLRLGDILLERGVVTPTPLQAALDLQARSGQGLGQILLQMGVVTEETLNWTLSERLRVPYVDLEDDGVDCDLIRPIPEELLRRPPGRPGPARRQRADGDPRASEELPGGGRAAAVELEAQTGARVSTAMATRDFVRHLLDKAFPRLREVDDARGHDRPGEPHDHEAHHRARGPDRVRPRVQELSGQPA